ncbi:cytochrome P450 [Rubrivirga sp. S365]|uniref:Cytochrome P450 n=1 Tax=Rubrivirga litoralis TaxID=3075598 RepID=A0ABU3BUP8_9BACT|nr:MULTISPECIES: cytochrome P450 [unclassified Rubrivirga]MDT0633015.1 cytochrome P450 [Rubrivirga sp. F394]MDT7856922.1 cytochrome P450 [Rubrivirga sp. S365]
MPAVPPSPDVRRYAHGSHRFELLAAFMRELKEGVDRLDAVGGDLVIAEGWPLPPVAHVRHPDLLRELLVDRNEDVTKARGLRLARTVLGDGLLTSEPPRHTRRRRLVLPAFHHGRLQGYGRTMVDLTRAETAGWAEGEPFDAAEAMNRLALAIAGQTLFGADVLSDADRVSGAVRDAMAGFDGAQYPLADRLMWLPTRANRRSKAARATLDALVYGLIDERRREPDVEHADLLGMLLDARDDEAGGALTDEEVRDEAMTLLLAGHETTAVALAWTWALLARNPDAEARLHAEVDALAAPPTFDDLDQLPYTRQVFAESMRLFPPAWTVGREAARDTELGGRPLPKGTTILFAPLHLHRDPRFWDEPEAFRPERFAPEARAGRHKFAYLPFSAGRRGCIGEQFAWIEGTLVLATVAQRWRLELAAAPPAAHGSVTLRPSGPVQMVATRR